MKKRTQFRLLDVYRIILDQKTDNIENVGNATITRYDELSVEIYRRGRLYSTEFCNISTIKMRRAAVKQINQRLKEVRV